MKRPILLSLILITCITLAGCRDNSSSSLNHQQKENSSLKAENSSLRAKSHSKSSEETENQESRSTTKNIVQSSSSEEKVINTPQDAARLVAHSMAADPSLYHAVETDGGYLVTRDDQKAFVNYNGSVTWENGDTQSYNDVADPTFNGKVNDVYQPSN